MLGWRRYGLPRVDRAASRGCSLFGADREARAAHRIPLRSAQDITSLLPAAEPVQSPGRANRAADRNLRTRMDISEAENARRKCPPLVGAADSGRRCGALALSARSYGRFTSATSPQSRSARCVKTPDREPNMFGPGLNP